jgi:hypothetical protein
MRLSKPTKPKIVVPVPSGISYKCTCGNRLCDRQRKCEICEALIDWGKAKKE